MVLLVITWTSRAMSCPLLSRRSPFGWNSSSTFIRPLTGSAEIILALISNRVGGMVLSAVIRCTGVRSSSKNELTPTAQLPIAAIAATSTTTSQTRLLPPAFSSFATFVLRCLTVHEYHPSLLLLLGDVEFSVRDGNQRATAATAAPPMPCRFNASATKPEAFISSINADAYASPAARPFGTAID